MTDVSTEVPALYQGDTWYIDVEVEFDGVAEDISGDKLWFSLKRLLSDPDSAAVLTHNQVIPTDADSVVGKARLIVPISKTTPVLAGSYYYDARLVKAGSPENNRRTLNVGKIKVLDVVTDDATP